jgi:hypothetical protein
LDTAFRLGSEFNVYAEEDFEFSPDALALAEAFRTSAHSTTDLMLAFRRVSEDTSRPEFVRTSGLGDGLMGAGFCCRSWAHPILSNWWLHYDPSFMWADGWDVSIGTMVEKMGYKVWRPMVNRSQHIGEVGHNTQACNFNNPGLSSPCFKGRVDRFVFEA